MNDQPSIVQQLSPLMHSLLLEAIETAIDIVNDMGKDDIKFLCVDNIREQSAIRLAQVFDPVNNEVDVTDIPATLINAMNQIIDSRIEFKI